MSRESEDDPKPGGQPRQVAVALQYDRHPDHAPRVVANGRGALAEAILERAFASGVKVRRDADLAELLSAVEIGDDIPAEAFVAVAEVIAHVYRANGTMAEFEQALAENEE
ncbi:MAG TPA: EscU/YscU/HrcU family type III secretion system export apparatus switch protein [Alphaproteobacteria bacterium]|nr:EscU/YscU/HrcU family type III secretion system export apparatus switch protein [Alphaproteobacteria bacterium]